MSEASAQQDSAQLALALAETLTVEGAAASHDADPGGLDGFAARAAGERMALAYTNESRFEVGAEIGRGGMGRVLEAKDRRFNRIVALKEAAPMTDPSRLRRFTMEALVTGNLEHPGIVPVYDRGNRPDGGVFYAMRRVAGRTLTEALGEAAQPADRLALVPALIKVAEAVAYAHRRGVIHRDLKPDNLMIGSIGEVFVLDWGIARVRGLSPEIVVPSDVPSGATQQGMAMGTPAYMAPEQARGDRDAVDERSDVFALGAILYHVLTGQSPYTAASVAEIIEQARDCRPPPVRQLAPHASAELAEICETAMARRPEERYRSALELARALEQAQSRAFARRQPAWTLWAWRTLVALACVASVLSCIATWYVMGRVGGVGWGPPLVVAMAAIGVALAFIEWRTAGSHRLFGLGLALAAATVLLAIASTATGLQTVFIILSAPKYVADAPEHRRLLAIGASEALAGLPLGMALGIAETLLWTLVRRATARARRSKRTSAASHASAGG